MVHLGCRSARVGHYTTFDMRRPGSTTVTISPDIRIRPSLTNSSRIGLSCEYRIAAFDRNRLRSSLPPLFNRIQRTRSRRYCEEDTNATTPYAEITRSNGSFCGGPRFTFFLHPLNIIINGVSWIAYLIANLCGVMGAFPHLFDCGNSVWIVH